MPRTAIILAAGEGTRLQAVLPDLPKGLIEVAGETLVGRSVRLLRSRGVERVVLVVGYRAERYSALAARCPELCLVRNESYATSGSLGSLERGIAALDGECDFLLLEGDLYYEARALDLLLDSARENLALISGPTGAGDEVWVEAPAGRLRALSKDVDELGEVHGELVGMWRLGPSAVRALARICERATRPEESKARSYETDGLAETTAVVPIWVQCEPHLLWGEVDDLRHLARLRGEIAPQILAAEGFLRR
jgi:choline kinase